MTTGSRPSRQEAAVLCPPLNPGRSVTSLTRGHGGRDPVLASGPGLRRPAASTVGVLECLPLRPPCGEGARTARRGRGTGQPHARPAGPAREARSHHPRRPAQPSLGTTPAPAPSDCRQVGTRTTVSDALSFKPLSLGPLVAAALSQYPNKPPPPTPRSQRDCQQNPRDPRSRGRGAVKPPAPSGDAALRASPAQPCHSTAWPDAGRQGDSPSLSLPPSLQGTRWFCQTLTEA